MGEKTKLSKFISLILRHKPETIGIQLDKYGWANVEELISGINSTGRFIDRDLLEEIVASDEKQRYCFNEDKTLIRANQGHSIFVDVQLKEAKPPQFLYHGTSEQAVSSIIKQGIKPMNRLYVHLSKEKETAVKVGKRHGKPIIFKVYSEQMYNDGIAFYLSENGVWLTKYVYREYLEQIDIIC